MLAGLAAEGLVDDGRFVEAFVRSHVGRGEGPVRIAAELRRRGIDPELIASGLEAPAAEWTARVREARRKRFGAGPPREIKERARQARFLQQRGFTMEQIHTALAGVESD